MTDVQLVAVLLGSCCCVLAVAVVSLSRTLKRVIEKVGDHDFDIREIKVDIRDIQRRQGLRVVD